MLFPVCVHGDAEGVSFSIPDLPGCFSAADSWEQIPAMTQEAVELYFEGENLELPQPSNPDQFAHDPIYKDGVWLMVDIDLSRLDTKPTRLNISLPRGLVEQLDKSAKAHGLTRSAFLAKAASQAMKDGLKA